MAPAEHVPRELLFGLLALQNGMITRDELVAAFGALDGLPGTKMGEILVLHSRLDSTERAFSMPSLKAT